jgi:hypothetical protein|uniref:Uncharacterized protein n=1 Tax=Zea mays TaxID=4577 RepID=A0A804MN84_MAIZE
MWPGPPSGAAGEASLTSRISTRRLVRFLILMATSCGLKAAPHTTTRPCFLSIRWLSSPARSPEGKRSRDVSETEAEVEVEVSAGVLFTFHLEERPPDPLVAPVAVDAHPQGHDAVGLLLSTWYASLPLDVFSSRKPFCED